MARTGRWFAVMTLAITFSISLSAAPAANAADGMTSLVSADASGTQGELASCAPAISADGRFVVFESQAENLVPGDKNQTKDIFVKDRLTGAVEIASVDSDGNQSNDWSDAQSISADGRFVAFRSLASNLVPGDTNGCTDIFVHDRVLRTT